MKRTLLLAVLSIIMVGCGKQAVERETTTQTSVTVTIDKIWDAGTHAAFTSLIKYKGDYYCTFREGYSHIFDERGEAEGQVRILKSSDGQKWQSVATLSMEGIDLRDPKLSEMPDGRLMVTIGGSKYRNRELVGATPMVSFSTDGEHFTTPQLMKLDEQTRTGFDWVWRVTWNDGVGYGVNYVGASNDHIDLLQTTDGIHYSLVSHVQTNGNETTLRFLPDGRMLMMVRRDSDDLEGQWAVSRPPYTQWNFQSMGFRIGGQDFVALDKEHLIVATRTYFNLPHTKTALYRGTVQGDWEEVYVLPSDGDTSYPGILVEGDEVWVSYYSSNGIANKTSIFLAKLPLSLWK